MPRPRKLPVGCTRFRRRGPGRKFVVFMQNHGQVGNRPLGDRLGAQVSGEGLKLAAGAVILSPYLPLPFMGEEYAETAPFLYFVDHGDPALVEAVRRGRKEEFGHFLHGQEPPDPQSEKTFLRSKLDPDLRLAEGHRTLREFYAELLRLRRELPPLQCLDRDSIKLSVLENEKVIVMHRVAEGEEALVIVCLNALGVEAGIPVPSGRWSRILDSAEEKWLGPGLMFPAQTESSGGIVSLSLAPESVLLLVRENAGF